MIDTYTLFTSEADLPRSAVAEILGQLGKISLRKNSVGIVICHYDYVGSGIIEALHAALPFPLVGATTFYQASSGTSGLFELTITVLTSDDVRFALAHSSIADGQETAREKVSSAYNNALGACGASPSLILSFLSAERPVSGDEYLRLLEEASGGVPTFGIVDSGEEETGDNIYIICRGEAFSNGVAMLLIAGEIDCGMYVHDTLEERLLDVSATVTSAEGIFVSEINSQPAVAYLKKHGVILDDIAEGDISTIPFYCRLPGDDDFVGRTLKTVTSDGALEFMAEIPAGSLMRIGTVQTEDILEESRAVVRKAASENPDAALLFAGSCVGRFITLGLDTTAEMDYALKEVPEGKNYLACYVGGEICPVRSGGRLANRYHNNSFIVLALR